MSRWRLTLVAILFTLPFVLMFIAGAYALWTSGWMIWLCWVAPVCFLLGYALIRFRPGRNRSDLPDNGPLPIHWTKRDEEAFEIVRREQQLASEIPVSRLADPHFYLQAAIDLSTKVAKHYHPKSSDPISSLTVLELLAAAQLSAEETAAWLHGHVPGSHLLTIRHWRALSDAPRWLRLASDVAWVVSSWWNPVNLPRWLATRFASSSASEEIEASLLSAFYREFLYNVGLYCIEMNSGRLRGGVAQYRAAMERLQRESPGGRPLPGTFARRSMGLDAAVQRQSATHPAPPGDDHSKRIDDHVRIALVGQVNAGKSSLINAILGQNRAKSDVLAATDAINRYRYITPRTGEKLELLDTPGYGSSELTSDQRTAIRTAWSQADVVLLVMDVTSPARQADWRLVDELRTYYLSQPHLKPPNVIGVLTHIDGLSPVMEWEPPYDWQSPTRPKEKSIRAAVEYAEQVFGDTLVSVIPVCSDAENSRVYGLDEWLMPALLATLPEAKAALVLRTLHQDTDSERLWQLVRQFRSAGVKLLHSLLEARSETPT